MFERLLVLYFIRRTPETAVPFSSVEHRHFSIVDTIRVDLSLELRIQEKAMYAFFKPLR